MIIAAAVVGSAKLKLASGLGGFHQSLEGAELVLGALADPSMIVCGKHAGYTQVYHRLGVV